MSTTDKNARKVRGASRKQYSFIAQKKVGDDVVAVRAKKSDAEVTRRGFSRGVRMWHRFTDGGEPICDVCKRVGHVARSCWHKKTSLSDRRLGCRGETGAVVHSVIKNRVYDTAADRYLEVSVNGQQVEALIEFNALENAVSFETVKVDPKLKIYDFRDGKTSSTWRLGALGVVWLPIVIGSRSDKLRCVVVEGLTEKLIIGLPGLSFLGVSVNFATGDVRIHRRRRKKIEDNTLAKKGSDELHEGHELVRDTEAKCKKPKNTTCSRAMSSDMKSPESRKECTEKQLLKQVKDLARKEVLHDDDRSKEKQRTPNPKEDENLVSGRGRKEKKVNVVSPKHEMLNTTNTTTTITTTTIPDHDNEKSRGEYDSDEDEDSEHEELESYDNGCTTTIQAHKSRRKKNKKKSKKRKKKGRK